MFFDPVTRAAVENVITSLLIIAAIYIEYSGKPFSALGFCRKKLTVKNTLVLAPLIAFGFFVVYVFAIVPVAYSSMSQLEGNLPVTVVWLSVVWATWYLEVEHHPMAAMEWYFFDEHNAESGYYGQTLINLL